MPNAHISTFSVYYCSLANYGAIHAGVPTLSLSFGFFFVKTVASPKSPITILPSLLNKILSVLRSRCTYPLTCMALSPIIIFSIIYATTHSGILSLNKFLNSLIDPPSRYSTNMYMYTPLIYEK